MFWVSDQNDVQNVILRLFLEELSWTWLCTDITICDIKNKIKNWINKWISAQKVCKHSSLFSSSYVIL